ncbi:hypothetical protein HS088_TW22G00685 [Tripterygium wilfordii]|uniref:NAC domain-containing protein n=1 Tax=Tripterygium wilfordii TaxID=458696 RepID=A0A7J7BYM4_TRIWF|nr:hypothetical protein HS088_TW22G00685 [Tripterygium wilfordii]
MENSNLPITRLKPLMPLRPPYQAGYWFRPTRQELILYLHKKLAKLPYPEDTIRDCDNIYGDKEGVHEPWNLLDTIRDCDNIYGDKEGVHEPWNLLDASDNTGEYFYVFTQLKKISTNCDSSKKIMRRAGSGTWHANASTDVKDYKGKLIGVNKYYKFESKAGDEVNCCLRRTQGEWTMHEFFLPRKQSPGDVVLCVIGCNSTITVMDDPESSIIFDKEICNTRMQPNRFRLIKYEERIMQDKNQQISRKRAFEQQTELGSLMTVVQQQLSTYGVEAQQNSRKRAQSSGGSFSSVSSQYDQPQADPVAEEGHRQFNEVMEDIEKTAASRGIPVEDYLDEILKNI